MAWLARPPAKRKGRLEVRRLAAAPGYHGDREGEPTRAEGLVPRAGADSPSVV